MNIKIKLTTLSIVLPAILSAGMVYGGGGDYPAERSHVKKAAQKVVKKAVSNLPYGIAPQHDRSLNGTDTDPITDPFTFGIGEQHFAELYSQAIKKRANETSDSDNAGGPLYVHNTYKYVGVYTPPPPPGGGDDGGGESTKIPKDYRHDYWHDQTTTSGTEKSKRFYSFYYTIFESSNNTGNYGAMTRTPDCGNIYAALVPNRKIYTCQDQYGNWSYFTVTTEWKGGVHSKRYFHFDYYTPVY